MKVTISPDILADSKLRDEIESLNSFLKERAGPIVQSAEVKWDLQRGQPDLVDFFLSDHVTGRHATFRRDDLHNKQVRELRALQAISYFLEQHSKRNQERIHMLLGQIAAEETANGNS